MNSINKEKTIKMTKLANEINLINIDFDNLILGYLIKQYQTREVVIDKQISKIFQKHKKIINSLEAKILDNEQKSFYDDFTKLIIEKIIYICEVLNYKLGTSKNWYFEEEISFIQILEPIIFLATKIKNETWLEELYLKFRYHK